MSLTLFDFVGIIGVIIIWEAANMLNKNHQNHPNMIFDHKEENPVNDGIPDIIEEYTDYTIEDFERWRKSENMTQQEFASFFGISAATYSQWVSGRREPPAYVLNMMRQIIDTAWTNELLEDMRTVGRHLGCIICKELEGHNQRRKLPEFTELYHARIQMLAEDAGTIKPYLVLAEIRPQFVDKLNQILGAEFVSDTD